MADELDVLLDKVGDASLRAQLRGEIDKVRAKRTFGLVFESHLPERVRLPEHPVRRGTKVVRRADKHGDTMKVTAVRRNQATVELPEGGRETIPLDDLVVVAEFGEPVYPGLTRLGSIDRGGDKPAHLVINAENHHALEMLQFTHAGKVDCIYIDPPYNTGAKDWKYDNNYVDNEDAYRHSKWLAFMERRLLLAKQLLNPDNSALIVTIDEKEYLRLGLLLQQTFPGSKVQMVSAVINPKGVGRSAEFSRTNEFVYFVLNGSAAVRPFAGDDSKPALLDWQTFRRRDLSSVRHTRPSQFYPIYVNVATGMIDEIGLPLAKDAPRASAPSRPGCVAVFPIRSDGTEMNWAVTGPTFEERLRQGYARAGKAMPDEPQSYIIQYLKSGPIDDIASGKAKVVGRNPDNSVKVVYTEARAKLPTTQWDFPSHNAEHHGTAVLKSLLPSRRFPFPKSLYAVEDAIRFFVADKPDAVILDFFAGSGTTAHAVMRLNRQDSGSRQAIIVTNNEVSADEAKSLTERGFRDGDAEWEALGIFEYITRPRVTAAATGLTPDGTPIKGDYKFTDEFPMADGFEENVEFLKLTYLDPVDVELDRAFAAVAPLLWARAGGQGSMIEQRADAAGELLPFATADRYGVLFDPDRWREFAATLTDSVQVVFVVTDSAVVFAGVAEQLPEGLEAVRLYENYLTTFAINRGSAS